MKQFKLHGLMDRVSAKRSQLLLTKEQKKEIWRDEQRHKWMCGEQPEYTVPEDCPF